MNLERRATDPRGPRGPDDDRDAMKRLEPIVMS